MLMEETVPIDAPPERVWQSFTDLTCWASWSSVLEPVAAPPGACLDRGETFSCHIRPLWFRIFFEATVLEADPPRRLVWETLAWGVHARHEFRLADNGRGGTLFESSERLSGPLIRLAGFLLPRRRLLGLTRAFMADLKHYAESRETQAASGSV